MSQPGSALHQTAVSDQSVVASENGTTAVVTNTAGSDAIHSWGYLSQIQPPGTMKRAKKTILKQSVNAEEVMKFGRLSRVQRLQILSDVREMDRSIRTKFALPTATAFAIFVVGLLASSMIKDGVIPMVFLGVLFVTGLGILWAARHDAHQESRHNAWLKAFETIDAEVTKREESV